jgi:hypothetical protein
MSDVTINALCDNQVKAPFDCAVDLLAGGDQMHPDQLR